MNTLSTRVHCSIRADIAKLSDKDPEVWFARYQQVMDKAK